jgi:organic radical activating enzyme
MIIGERRMKMFGDTLTRLNEDKTIEIQCILHTMCNLRCKFCYQTKEKGIRDEVVLNVNYIKQLPDDIVKTITPIMKDHDIRILKITILGGELLSDDIPDSVFDLYREFLYDLQFKLDKQISGVKYEVLSMSNGVFSNLKRVGDFLKEFSAKISLSYDPRDRFTSEHQKDIWYDSFQYLHDIGIETYIAAVISKRNIDAYIEGDKFFEKLGNTVLVELEEYSPRLDYYGYLPNDDDLFNFYKWALDNNKFNISHISNILEHSPVCTQGFVYVFGEHLSKQYNRPYIHECDELFPFTKQEYYGEYADQISDTSNCAKCKQPLGLQKRGCLFCDYYSHCPKMCWSQVLFDKYEMTTCPIQRIYNYIKDNPSILSNYKNWRRQNA